ncbi:Tat (twin-arginine translocation) pathway signal sequence [Halobiforma haloterrestris]|uniref:Tat (Twin-arginine translocation) pathway signal sequence n=1 Tax=Natronobacterium haloterrestre TaxID=148448 RepID=A0A1I1IBA2_NATHA|nr:twin-arginine translocation signal domain-containing protein [Halobiforma haloterrestris]SFC33649.1 Tat (twin-arginine translocation) pathway signal sequence [Halobiforma haloterrestris]
MTVDEGSRRTFLKAAGAAGATVLVAGCSGNDGDGDGEDETENGNEDDGGSDGFEIDPGTQIELDGQTAGWEGLAPGDIEGEQNPTLILQEGEDYEIGWTQGDGSQHNIEIRDDGGDVVDDLSTEQVAEPEDQWLEFTASSEMASYVCNPHETTMIGDIVVE